MTDALKLLIDFSQGMMAGYQSDPVRSEPQFWPSLEGERLIAYQTGWVTGRVMQPATDFDFD